MLSVLLSISVIPVLCVICRCSHDVKVWLV